VLPAKIQLHGWSLKTERLPNRMATSLSFCRLSAGRGLMHSEAMCEKARQGFRQNQALWQGPLLHQHFAGKAWLGLEVELMMPVVSGVQAVASTHHAGRRPRAYSFAQFASWG